MSALWPVMYKEFLHIVRDQRSLLAILALPLLQLLLFGYAISFDISYIDLAVADQDHTQASRALVQALTADGTVRVVQRVDGDVALGRALDDGRARLGLLIPPDYAADLASGQDVPVQLLVDGTDATFAGQALQQVAGSLQTRIGRDVQTMLRTHGRPGDPPGLVTRPRVLFNESLDSHWFIIPGLIAVIVSMLAAMVTSQCIAREYEQGTIEQILVSPISGPAMMLGKLVPYVGIGVIQVVSVTLASRFLFGVPIRGSLWLLSIGTLLYLVGSMAFGLMISALLKSQQVAMQVSLIATMLPSLLLSGFIFPISNMPLALQGLSYVVAARYYIVIARGLFLKGVGLAALWPQFVAMVIYAAVLVLAAISRFRRSV